MNYTLVYKTCYTITIKILCTKNCNECQYTPKSPINFTYIPTSGKDKKITKETIKYTHIKIIAS